MTHRELFHEIMFYGEFDRMPVIHWAGWKETHERWLKEGLPADKSESEFTTNPAFYHLLPADRSEFEFLNAVPPWTGIGVNLAFLPGLESKLLEETDEYRISRGSDGVVRQSSKSDRTSIPCSIDFTLKGAGDWDDFKKRLQPDPARIPRDLDQKIGEAEASGLPIFFRTASMMGWIRNWMGVQNMSYLMYDDPDVYADMVMTLADLTCWGIDQVLPKIKVDAGFSWEDICGSAGPLVSPNIFHKCVAPGYRKIRDKLEEYGVVLYGIDTDGDVTDLIGPWLDAGVNLQFPIQVGPFGGDAMKFRKIYGKELRVIGNFDKMTLEQGRDAIEAEIQRLIPLMKEGGFIMTPDHSITPGVPLDDYVWYLERVRELRF